MKDCEQCALPYNSNALLPQLLCTFAQQQNVHAGQAIYMSRKVPSKALCRSVWSRRSPCNLLFQSWGTRLCWWEQVKVNVWFWMLKLRVVASVQSDGVTSNISKAAVEQLHGTLHQVLLRYLARCIRQADCQWWSVQYTANWVIKMSSVFLPLI